MTKRPVDPQELFLSLLKADKEEDVVEILTKAGYWERPDAWRFYGDQDANWGQIGAQQSLPESALVEKLTNSIDALLLAECRVSGMNPESPKAPQSMSEAVAKFFGSKSSYGAGDSLAEWMGDKQKLGVLARRLTITVTGAGHVPRSLSLTRARGSVQSSFPKLSFP